MAGLGRRSHYRKHLTDSVLHDYPEPNESDGDRIAKISGTRGGNIFEIIVASPISTGTNERQKDVSTTTTSCASDDKCEGLSSNEKKYISNEPQLAILPTKFRKLVWVKRGDYVIVDCGDENTNDDHGGVRFLIKNVLYKKQVAHLKNIGMWPKDSLFLEEESNADDYDDEIKAKAIRIMKEQKEKAECKDQQSVTSDGDEEYDEYQNGYVENDDLFINPNRLVGMRIQDSDSETDSDSD